MALCKLKLIVIGDTNCGKSSLLSRDNGLKSSFYQCSDKIDVNEIAKIQPISTSLPAVHSGRRYNCYVDHLPAVNNTIGVDYYFKTITCDLGDVENSKHIKMIVYDTSGQKPFRSYSMQYYRGAHGVFLVYDVTNAKSLRHCFRWLKIIKEKCHPDVSICLIGNKTDLAHLRQVSTIDGQNFKKMHPSINFFVESSAKTNVGLSTAFHLMTQHVVAKLESNVFYSTPIVVNNSIRVGATHTHTASANCCVIL